MRILFLLTQDLESPSGGGRYFPLARELTRRGHTVRIAALHGDYTSLRERCEVRQGVSVEYVGQMHVLKRGGRKAYFPPLKLAAVAWRATWGLTCAALRWPAEIVHVGKPHPMNGLAGLLAKVLRRRTLFLDCDDLEAASNRFAAPWQQSLVAFFERRLPRYADHVTTQSTFLQERLLEWGVPSGRVTEIPNAADHQRFAALDEGQVAALRASLGLAGRDVVAYIGSLSAPSHALDLLLPAFVLLHQKRPTSALLIVGNGEERERLERQVREAGLMEAVRFVGYVPAERVALYYRLANVVVDPVRDDAAGRARAPLKMFESWAAGVPFVSGEVGDRRRWLGEPPAGLLVPPGDVQALAQGLYQVLCDPALALALIQRGKERSREYSWECAAATLEAVYAQALRRKDSGRPT